MPINIIKNYRKVHANDTLGALAAIDSRVTILENNEYKITYYEVVSGTSGVLTPPTNATINSGEFGLSGNAILSKVDGSNKVTFESPKTVGGVIVTTSLNTTTGAWVASGTYTDPTVAVIYSIKVRGIDFQYLNLDRVIETAEIEEKVTFIAPLSYDYTTNKATIPQSNTTIDGYLSSTDWNTFNNKEPTIASGTTLQYWRGDKTFVDFMTDVRATVLSGFNSTISWARVTTSTTIQNAISLLQKQSNYLQSTRFISGTGVTINADTTKFDIQVEGEIVDPTTFIPTTISKTQTGISATYIGSQVESYVWIDSTNTIIQSLNPPTPDLFDSIVGYWVLVHSNLTTINVINSFPLYADGLASQFRVVMKWLGFRKFAGGNIVSAGTTGTRIACSSGYVIKDGIGASTKRPDLLLSTASDPSTMEMRHRNGVSSTGVQNVDVTNYNPTGSTVSALGNNRFQALKIWRFASGLIRFQYGQTEYSNLDAAVAGISKDPYVDEGNASRNGLHVGWLVAKKGITWGSGGTGTLGSDYIFLDVVNGNVSGASTVNLQGAYDNSSQPQFLVNDTKGDLQVQNARASDTSSVFSIKNIAGTVTAWLTGAGVLYRNWVRTNGGNAAYNILSTDQIIYTGTVLTAPRTWTLPSAANVRAGEAIYIRDLLRTITTTNTITIAVQTGESLNGVTNGTNVMNTVGAERMLYSDGVSSWYFDSSLVRLDATQTLTNKNMDSSTATTQAANDNSTKIATTAYVDSSVSAITVRRIHNYQNTDSTTTGSTNETVLANLQVTGGVMGANGVLSIDAFLIKSGTAGSCVWKAYVSTVGTNSVGNTGVPSSSTQIGSSTQAATNITGGRFLRRMANKNSVSTQYVWANNASAVSDVSVTSNARTAVNINTASDFWVVITATLANSGDTAILSDIQLNIDKP